MFASPRPHRHTPLAEVVPDDLELPPTVPDEVQQVRVKATYNMDVTHPVRGFQEPENGLPPSWNNAGRRTEETRRGDD